jgi:hypothetical protein
MASASAHFGQRSLNNKNQEQSGIETTNQGRFRLEIDSRADTMCCGKVSMPIGKLDKVCDVYGFHPSMSAIKNVPIQTCATAFEHEDGETITLVFGQAPWG